MNDVNSPAQASSVGSGRGGPLLARPHIVVGEIPSALAIGDGRGAGYWPLAQLVKDWNNQPDSRALMLAGGLLLARSRHRAEAPLHDPILERVK